MEVSPKGILCTWISGFNEKIRYHAAVLNIEERTIQINSLEPQKLDIWYGKEKYTRSTAGEYFPIIPLSNGNFGMVTTIQNLKANREGFTWWELVLNKF
jgi:hypothetical protein